MPLRHQHWRLGLLGGAAFSALVATTAFAGTPDEDAARDARIAKLEAAVEALQGGELRRTTSSCRPRTPS